MAFLEIVRFWDGDCDELEIVYRYIDIAYSFNRKTSHMLQDSLEKTKPPAHLNQISDEEVAEEVRVTASVMSDGGGC